MITNGTIETADYDRVELSTHSLLPFASGEGKLQVKTYPVRNIGFGAALLCSNVISLSLVLISTSVGKSTRRILLSSITNGILFSLCLVLYGVIALVRRLETTDCWGFSYVLIATSFCSYMTMSQLSFFNYYAVLRPMRFKILATTQRTTFHIACVWFLSWACAFCLVGWQSEHAICNVYVWFSRSKLLVGEMILTTCISLVFFFNIRVFIELRQQNMHRDTRRQPLMSDNIKLETRQPLTGPEKEMTPELAAVMTHQQTTPDEVQPLQKPEKETPGTKRWKNDPRVRTDIISITEASTEQDSHQLASCRSTALRSCPRNQKLKRTSITLSILTLWPCIMTLPVLIFSTAVVTVGNPTSTYFGLCRYISSGFLLVNYFGNPILHAWRLLEWTAILKKFLSFWGE